MKYGNLFGHDWKQAIKAKQQLQPVIIDEETGELLTESKINRDKRQAMQQAVRRSLSSGGFETIFRQVFGKID